jgi:hypothetical protein
MLPNGSKRLWQCALAAKGKADGYVVPDAQGMSGNGISVRYLCPFLVSILIMAGPARPFAAKGRSHGKIDRTL